jgi:hypothetical protein
MLKRTPSRLTLVVGNSNNGPDWTPASVMHVESLAMLRSLLATEDVERIILDRSNSPEAYLQLLSSLPASVAADIVLVREDGGGFLSAMGRGGDRVLYSLAVHDLEFYLDTHDLTAGVIRFALTA